MLKLSNNIVYFPKNKNSFKQVLSCINKAKMSKKYKQITIPVTDLASLCGMDHYNNWGKSICKLWKQIYPDDYNNISRLVNSKSLSCVTDNNMYKLKLLEKKIGTSNNISNKVKHINGKASISTHTLRKNQIELENEIEKELKKNKDAKITKEDKEELIKLMNSSTNVVYGCKNENIGINEFQRITGKKICEFQTKLIHPWADDELENGDKIQWVIVGKIDGLTSDRELVEVKNRQKCLFHEVRDYEKCQLQAYLDMLDIEMAYLVEVITINNKPDVCILQERRDVNYMSSLIYPHLQLVREFVKDIGFMNDEDKFKLLSGQRKTF
jgi:hypothetical protein